MCRSSSPCLWVYDAWPFAWVGNRSPNRVGHRRALRCCYHSCCSVMACRICSSNGCRFLCGASVRGGDRSFMNPLILAPLGILALLSVSFFSYKSPRLTAVIWWAFAAAVLSSAVFIVHFPGELRVRLLWAGFLLPFYWVAIQFWVYWERKTWLINAVLIGASVFSALVLFFSKSVV